MEGRAPVASAAQRRERSLGRLMAPIVAEAHKADLQRPAHKRPMSPAASRPTDTKPGSKQMPRPHDLKTSDTADSAEAQRLNESLRAERESQQLAKESREEQSKRASRQVSAPARYLDSVSELPSLRKPRGQSETGTDEQAVSLGNGADDSLPPTPMGTAQPLAVGAQPGSEPLELSCTCCFCHRPADEKAMYGLGTLKRMARTAQDRRKGTSHLYYHEACAAYGSGMRAIPTTLAEVEDDIIREWHRGGNLMCFLCKDRKVKPMNRATLGCAHVHCRVSLHYPCARELAVEHNIHFAMGPREIVCEKHKQWYLKLKNRKNPDNIVESDFLETRWLGMWMEGTGGWNGATEEAKQRWEALRPAWPKSLEEANIMSCSEKPDAMYLRDEQKPKERAASPSTKGDTIEKAMLKAESIIGLEADTRPPSRPVPGAKLKSPKRSNEALARTKSPTSAGRDRFSLLKQAHDDADSPASRMSSGLDDMKAVAQVLQSMPLVGAPLVETPSSAAPNNAEISAQMPSISNGKKGQQAPGATDAADQPDIKLASKNERHFHPQKLIDREPSTKLKAGQYLNLSPESPEFVRLSSQRHASSPAVPQQIPFNPHLIDSKGQKGSVLTEPAGLRTTSAKDGANDRLKRHASNHSTSTKGKAAPDFKQQPQTEPIFKKSRHDNPGDEEKPKHHEPFGYAQRPEVATPTLTEVLDIMSHQVAQYWRAFRRSTPVLSQSPVCFLGMQLSNEMASFLPSSLERWQASGATELLVQVVGWDSMTWTTGLHLRPEERLSIERSVVFQLTPYAKQRLKGEVPSSIPTITDVTSFYVPKMDQRVGLHGQEGLLARALIRRGTVLGSLSGTLMLKAEYHAWKYDFSGRYRPSQINRWWWEALHEAYQFELSGPDINRAFEWLKDCLVLSTVHEGNLLSLVNDPETDPMAYNGTVDYPPPAAVGPSNVFPFVVSVAGFPVVVVVSLMDIQPGQEIVFRYGRAYWNSLKSALLAANAREMEEGKVNAPNSCPNETEGL